MRDYPYDEERFEPYRHHEEERQMRHPRPYRPRYNEEEEAWIREREWQQRPPHMRGDHRLRYFGEAEERHPLRPPRERDYGFGYDRRHGLPQHPEHLEDRSNYGYAINQYEAERRRYGYGYRNPLPRRPREGEPF